MRAALLAIAMSAIGCMTLSLGGGLNGGLGNSPNRVYDGQWGVGTYIAIKDAVVIEPSFDINVGPLRKSELVLAFGLRALTHSHHWRPGFFGVFTAAGGASDPQHPEREIIARQYRVGAGVSWDTHKYLEPEDDPWWYDSYGVIALGVVYTHQRQRDEGGESLVGDFLGIELTFTGGFSVQGLVQALTDGNPDAH